MATTGGKPTAPVTDGGRSGSRARTPRERTLEDWLFEEGYVFDFFQAVRVMERLLPERSAVGLANPPASETVRLHARLSLDFPPSTIYEIRRPTADIPLPAMTVSFMGLTGPSGVLPRHYTELLLRLDREAKGREKHALRDWFDLFNHRFISLFYRAWEKYRFFLPFERREFAKREPDPFTLGLLSLMGLSTPSLRNRLRITTLEIRDHRPQERELGRIDDLALLRYSGFFAHRPRNAVNLEAMLRAYLRLPVDVIQFHGQWLRLEPDNCTALGGPNQMGLNVIVGDRIWDVQSKIRIRLGPLSYEQFQAFLPDRSPIPERKALFLLTKLVRLYVGPEMDMEFQLVLRKDEVPGCNLGPGAGGMGSRLGWNTWSRRKPKTLDAEEAVFQAEDLIFSASRKE
ncbi:MAG: type VI secretion system baseplate subunit TssG [Planctomycetes bacterium]|nr:type VI secretion system baseplate subunit TssG [Planctomycetota bacterium]